MSLIAILISLLAEKFITTVQDFRRFTWLEKYSNWLTGAITLPATVMVILVIALPLLLLALVFSGTNGFLDFVIGTAILIYALGPKEINNHIEQYIDACDREDKEAAFLYAGNFTSLPGNIESNDQLNSYITSSILKETCHRYTGVIFWFLVLGPLGALLFRLSAELTKQSSSDEGFSDSASQLYYILSWLPAHLTALSFGLGGSMVDTYSNWRSHHNAEAERTLNSNDEILINCGRGALQIESTQEHTTDQVQLALGLANRSVMIWVSLVAIMTLADLV